MKSLLATKNMPILFTFSNQVVFFTKELINLKMKTKLINLANMKKLLFTIALAGITGLTFGQKVPWYGHKDDASRGAFGPDTRAEAKSKWEYRDYMRATATAVQKNQVKGDKVYCMDLKTYINRVFGDYPINEEVRFQDQPTAGFCTGFLIAPDILVTAGHCITNQEDLLNTVWVFDYTSDVNYNRSGGYITIPESNQYYGIEILDTKLTNDQAYDYCVIRLNRKADRKPYKFRTGGAVTFDDMIAMIGSPSGLPLKVADSARVTNNEDYSTSFLTDLDAFHGNSGGPVFNLYGFIEGILVRGPGWDYHVDEECGCIKQDSRWDLYYYFGLQAETGNGVHRITSIPWNLLQQGVYRNLEVAIQDNNMEEFKGWSIYTWIWKKENEISGKDNLLALAAKNGRGEMLDYVIGTEGLNINAKDMYGTPLVHLMAASNLSSSIYKAAAIEGFDINARNNDNETALMVAARNGNLDAVNALLSAGANVTATSYTGKTARAIAKAAKNKEIAKIIKKAEKAKK